MYNGFMNGVSSKQQIIASWRKLRPSGTKSQCMRELGGLSRPTIDKYWDGEYLSAEEKVRNWALENKDLNVSQCSRDTGVSRPTVRKYLRSAMEQKKTDGAFSATVDDAESGQLGFGF